MSQSVSEKAKLIRGDPPKIDFKKKGEPPKNKHFFPFSTHIYIYGKVNWELEVRA